MIFSISIARVLKYLSWTCKILSQQHTYWVTIRSLPGAGLDFGDEKITKYIVFKALIG